MSPWASAVRRAGVLELPLATACRAGEPPGLSALRRVKRAALSVMALTGLYFGALPASAQTDLYSPALAQTAVGIAASLGALASSATHDLDGNGFSDVVWHDSSGNTSIWLMNGAQAPKVSQIGEVPVTWAVIGQRDFDGDGKADLLWRNVTGDIEIWLMNGAQITSAKSLGNVPTNWSVFGTGDLNGDGKGDLLWRDNTSGTVLAWFMNGSEVLSTANFGTVSNSWTIVADDRNGDIFWRNTDGDLAIWQVSGTKLVQNVSLGNMPMNWVIVGIGDFNGDGVVDILWRDRSSGTVLIWLLGAEFAIKSGVALGAVPVTWNIAETGDYNGDGTSDILWIDSGGNIAVWFINDGTVGSTASFGKVDIDSVVQAQSAE